MNTGERRLAAQADEIILKKEITVFGIDHGANAMICHRHDRMGNFVLLAQRAGDLGEGLALGQTAGAFDMSGKVFVAELEPVFAANFLERFHKVPGLVPDTPSAFSVINVCEFIENGIQVRADKVIQMQKIITGIYRDHQL